MSLIDAHCHLADSRFDGARNQVLERARQRGISGFIQGGVDPTDWESQLRLGGPGWYYSFGLHPWFVASQNEVACEVALTKLPDYLDQAHALGELGLDHSRHCPRHSWARQERYFARQLALAVQKDMPVILHVVSAHGQAQRMLREHGQSWRGIVHGFSGSLESAEHYLNLGFHLSIGGGLTRPGFAKLKRAVAGIPADRLVVESDAPDGCPAGWQGLNEPTSIFEVAAELARIRSTTAELVLQDSSRHLRQVFNLE